MNDVFDLSLNHDYYACLANDFIHGRLDLSLLEQRLFYLAVSQIVQSDTDYKTYQVSLADLAAFFGVPSSNLSRDLETICYRLLRQVIRIRVSSNNWEMFQLVNTARYKNGVLTLRLSDEIKPYLIGLNNYYTQCLLGTLLSFNSKYTNRLYTLIKCDSGYSHKYVFRFTVTELREIFQIPDKKYKLPADLLKKTIKPALEELSNSDYCYVWDYEEIRSKKRGKPLEYVTFKAVVFDNKSFKDLFLEDFQNWADEINAGRADPYYFVTHYKIFSKE